MFKKIFKALIILFCIYAAVWLCQNLDFNSVFTNMSDTIKYECRLENLKQGFEALNKAMK